MSSIYDQTWLNLAQQVAAKRASDELDALQKSGFVAAGDPNAGAMGGDPNAGAMGGAAPPGGASAPAAPAPPPAPDPAASGGVDPQAIAAQVAQILGMGGGAAGAGGKGGGRKAEEAMLHAKMYGIDKKLSMICDHLGLQMAASDTLGPPPDPGVAAAADADNQTGSMTPPGPANEPQPGMMAQPPAQNPAAMQPMTADQGPIGGKTADVLRLGKAFDAGPLESIFGSESEGSDGIADLLQSLTGA